VICFYGSGYLQHPGVPEQGGCLPSVPHAAGGSTQEGDHEGHQVSGHHTMHRSAKFQTPSNAVDLL